MCYNTELKKIKGYKMERHEIEQLRREEQEDKIQAMLEEVKPYCIDKLTGCLKEQESLMDTIEALCIELDKDDIFIDDCYINECVIEAVKGLK